MVRESIFGTNPVFVETLCGELTCDAKGEMRVSRCLANVVDLGGVYG
jgi:hypothetical protein